MDKVNKFIRKKKSIRFIKLPPGPDWISLRVASGPRAACLTPLIYAIVSLLLKIRLQEFRRM